MAKALLINPSYSRTYGSAKARITSPVYPTLGLATIAASARQRGHKIVILDLSFQEYDPDSLRQRILEERPDIVGVTATTPLFNQLRDISCLVKAISEYIFVVGGGAHPSALPYESLRESTMDFVAYGEADETFADLMDGRAPAETPGLYYRRGDEILSTPPRPLVERVDDLPMPAWDLYPIEEYRARHSRIIVRRPPAAMVEFSRGCVFKCDFCGSRNTMGFGYRKKSPARCADEMEHLYRLGYREAILADDIFTSDHNWALAVCEELVRRGNKMAWTCTNGIRVDSANDRLFDTMRRAGCYRVHFGFESGNDTVLKAFGKGGRATVEQGLRAVASARKAGMDTFGMYMVGLSSDTEESMRDTIEFARRAPVDMMRFGVTVPLPGTPMFNDLRRTDKILSYDWDLYNVYNTRQLFNHPHLSWDIVEQYYQKAYREAFLKNPAFILRRFIRGVKTGEFFWDLYYTVRFLLARSENREDITPYAYRDQWPAFEFRTDNMRPTLFQQPRPREGGLAVLSTDNWQRDELALVSLHPLRREPRSSI